MSAVDELYQAIEADDGAAIRRLLETDSDLVEGGDATPPPIHWAIFHDRAAIAELLLAHGADIDRRDQDRSTTPLGYAIVYGRAGIARNLIDRGSSLSGMHDLAARGAAGAFDEYPDVARREQFAEMVELLREL